MSSKIKVVNKGYTITANIVHLATKLAHEATVNHFMDSNIYEDEGDLYLTNGTVIILIY